MFSERGVYVPPCPPQPVPGRAGPSTRGAAGQAEAWVGRRAGGEKQKKGGGREAAAGEKRERESLVGRRGRHLRPVGQGGGQGGGSGRRRAAAEAEEGRKEGKRRREEEEEEEEERRGKAGQVDQLQLSSKSASAEESEEEASAKRATSKASTREANGEDATSWVGSRGRLARPPRNHVATLPLSGLPGPAQGEGLRRRAPLARPASGGGSGSAWPRRRRPGRRGWGRPLSPPCQCPLRTPLRERLEEGEGGARAFRGLSLTTCSFCQRMAV